MNEPKPASVAWSDRMDEATVGDGYDRGEPEPQLRRYCKRPVTIEALQLRWDTWNEMCDFAGVGRDSKTQPRGCWVDPSDHSRTSHDAPLYDVPFTEQLIGMTIPTLEGMMLAVEGDYVIRGVQGELYPCKPQIFEQTYSDAELCDALPPTAADYLRSALEDIRDHGTRHDLNPSVANVQQAQGYDFWQPYLQSADQSVRDRARRALEQADLADPKDES